MLHSIHTPLLPWHQPLWGHLQSYIHQQRIPQALMIVGRKGVGKRQLAERFAQALLCSQPLPDLSACGTCDSCLLVSASTHPDYLDISPEEAGKSIGIGQIRQLLVKLGLKPQYEGLRVVMINPAEQMSHAAANAFLKTLEEPGERTVMILICEQPGKLPATIRSRCQQLMISTPDKSATLDWFKQQGFSGSHELLFNLTQGAPLLAQHYAQNDMLQIRTDCLKTWLGVAKQQINPVIVAESWQKLPEADVLLWITSWVIDTIKCAYHAKTENLYNPDGFKAFKELALKLDLKRIYALYDLLLASRQRLDTQVNKLSLFEEILINWAALNRR